MASGPNALLHTPPPVCLTPLPGIGSVCAPYRPTEIPIMTMPEPRRSVPRSSFAIAMKDYTFMRPGIAVTISAATLIIALIYKRGATIEVRV